MMSATKLSRRDRADDLDMLLRRQRTPPLPAWDREYRFSPPRKWRFDFAWPGHKLAIEVDGGLWVGGRHNRARGYITDCEKLLAAQLLGWRVVKIPSDWLDEMPLEVVRAIMALLDVNATYSK